MTAWQNAFSWMTIPSALIALACVIAIVRTRGALPSERLMLAAIFGLTVALNTALATLVVVA